MMNLTSGSAYVVMVGNSYQSPVAVFAEKHGAEKLAEQIDQHVIVKVVEVQMFYGIAHIDAGSILVDGCQPREGDED